MTDTTSKLPLSDDELRGQVQELASTNADEFSRLLKRVLLTFAERFRSSYDALFTSMAMQLLRDSGFVDRLSGLKQQLASNDVQGAGATVAALEEWIARTDASARMEMMSGPVRVM